MTTGPGMRSRPLARVPSNVHVVESVPHGAVLPHVDLVITHGGHGTLIRALAGGVPVMVVPISRDQPDNAARVLYHHVGVKASKRSSPEKFAGVMRRALADDALHAARPRMAKRLAPDMGAPKAVAALEDLGGATTTSMRCGQCSFLMTKYEPRMVPASFDFCRANLKEESSSGMSMPSDSLKPTARLPPSSSPYITLIDRPLS